MQSQSSSKISSSQIVRSFNAATDRVSCVAGRGDVPVPDFDADLTPSTKTNHGTWVASTSQKYSFRKLVLSQSLAARRV